MRLQRLRFPVLFVALLFSAAAGGQSPPAQSPPPASQQAQVLAQNPAAVKISLDDAIQRGLRQNLGLILQTSDQKNANGQRLEELQSLLPTVNASASLEVQQINLAAFGLKFPGLNPIVGPFQVVDFRAYLTQNLVNVSALKNYLAAKHNFEGAKFTAEDARDLVVLTVGNAYLLCVADEDPPPPELLLFPPWLNDVASPWLRLSSKSKRSKRRPAGSRSRAP